jgi:hypothetical protein
MVMGAPEDGPRHDLPRSTADAIAERAALEGPCAITKPYGRRPPVEREAAALDEIVRRKIMEALDDPRPDVGVDEASGRLPRVL